MFGFNAFAERGFGEQQVSAAPPALATKVTFSVVIDNAGTPAPDASGLDYAFYDQPRISAGQAPVKFGSTFAIAGGTATIDITGVTALYPGGTGRIEYGTADGVKLGGGQVAVS
jgi:hypothetical protein